MMSTTTTVTTFTGTISEVTEKLPLSNFQEDLKCKERYGYERFLRVERTQKLLVQDYPKKVCAEYRFSTKELPPFEVLTSFKLHTIFNSVVKEYLEENSLEYFYRPTIIELISQGGNDEVLAKEKVDDINKVELFKNQNIFYGRINFFQFLKLRVTFEINPLLNVLDFTKKIVTDLYGVLNNYIVMVQGKYLKKSVINVLYTANNK